MDTVPAVSEPNSGLLNPQNLFSVYGMVVVVTGGGTGIGLMISSALETNGATVYIVGRRLDVLEKAARDNNKHGKIIPLQGDITSRESLLVIVDTIKARHGYIDLLINNAGIARNILPRPLPSPTDQSIDKGGPPSIHNFQSTLWDSGSPAGFSDTFETNVTAPYFTTVAFLDLLHQGNVRPQATSITPKLQAPRPRPTSQVLTVSSSGAFRVDANVLSVSYTLAKHASTHLGKLLANILAPWGIRSNVLAPGVWPTEMTSSQSLTPELLVSTVPLGRAGTLEDMAGVSLFLASRAGAYVNGAVWLMDGGRVGSVASSY